MPASDQLDFDFGRPQLAAPAPQSRAPEPQPRPEPEAQPPPAPEPPAAELHDFGEKIGGARKDAPAVTGPAPAAPAGEARTFAEAWPLTKAGHAVDAASKETRAKAWGTREEARDLRRLLGSGRGWLRSVEHLRDAVRDPGRSELSGMEASAVRRGHAAGKVYAAIGEQHWHLVRKVRVLDPHAPGTPSVGLTVAGHRRSYMSPADPKLPREVDEAARAPASKTISYGIYRMRNESRYWIAPTNLRGADRSTRLREFDSLADARAYLRDAGHRPELDAPARRWAEQHHVGRADVRSAKNAERIGDDYRGGRDVTPQQFMDEFGFRAVEFGNWVGQGNEKTERQGQLNRTYDALRDLASVTCMKPRELSLNGSLALSFGARGHGGKGAPLAHYEPDKQVIALTKESGPGCLAHEWFHALDHYTAAGGNARGHAWQPGTTAFNDLHRAASMGGVGARSRALDKGSGRGYWSRAEEVNARIFEAHVHQKLADAGRSDDFLVNLRGAEEFGRDKADGLYPYPTAEESRALAPAVEAAVARGRETVHAAANDQARTDRESDPRADETQRVQGTGRGR